MKDILEPKLNRFHFFFSVACVKDVATANGSPCDGEVKVDDDMTGNTWCCPVDGEKARYEGGLVNGGGFFKCTCQTDAVSLIRCHSVSVEKSK